MNSADGARRITECQADDLAAPDFSVARPRVTAGDPDRVVGS
nr:hypothetical protein [Rhodococcus sp. (in: high G+C Gram-positive bacteria)]